MKRVRSGFTLVEILIVVIILGIMAAIGIPQFLNASTDSKLSNLKTNLQTVRAQLLLYKTQHIEHFPDAGISTELTMFTDITGGTATAADATHTFGPYLQAMPINPISNTGAVRFVTGVATLFAAPTTDAGWYYNSDTGEFRADLTNTWAQPDGAHVQHAVIKVQGPRSKVLRMGTFDLGLWTLASGPWTSTHSSVSPSLNGSISFCQNAGRVSGRRSVVHCSM